jgi:hypothetical protein
MIEFGMKPSTHLPRDIYGVGRARSDALTNLITRSITTKGQSKTFREITESPRISAQTAINKFSC